MPPVPGVAGYLLWSSCPCRRGVNRLRSRQKPLRFGQPLPRLGGVGVIEVSDRRFREWFAERRHAVLPPLFPDHREFLDVGEVVNGELGVLPQCAGFPAVEGNHIEQYAQRPVLPNESVKLRHKLCVIRLYQLAALVDRAQAFRRRVAGNAAGKRKLEKELLQPDLILADVGIDLAVRCLRDRCCPRPPARRARDGKRRSSRYWGLFRRWLKDAQPEAFPILHATAIPKDFVRRIANFEQALDHGR